MGYFERIFPCSMTIKRQYERFYFLPKEKLQCLYLGIPKPRQSQPKTPNAIPVITCTAFHSPIKGVDVLLNALKILKHRQLRFRCFQIGGGSSELDGQDTAQLKELCTSLGLDDVVTWVGITNHVDHYLHQTDIYCQPSRTEAICLSIAEAMACEIPVVASNVGGIPELVEDGTTGFLVEPDDPVALANQLELLIREEPLRTSMGRKSKERIDEIAFYQEKSAEQLVEMYG
jgi:glycosyltransferase involved in cell wall biosynthesis